MANCQYLWLVVLLFQRLFSLGKRSLVERGQRIPNTSVCFTTFFYSCDAKM